MSGRRFSFEVNRISSAPAATLFRIETDGAGWSRWAGPTILHSSWEREGDPAPGGIGAVRKVGTWPMLMLEETLEYEQDRKHVYGFAAKGPVKDYRAELLLEPNPAGGTKVRWSGSFVEGVPFTGPILRAFLRNTIDDISKRLIATAERESA